MRTLVRAHLHLLQRVTAATTGMLVVLLLRFAAQTSLCLIAETRGFGAITIAAGKVAFCEITNTTTKSATSLVMMETIGAAKKAIQLFKGADVNGQKIVVGPYKFN